MQERIPIACPEFESLLCNVEERYPQLNVDDIITMLTREQIIRAFGGICVVPWFESRLMEYLHYCGYQEYEKEDQERNENSEHDDSSEDEDEQEDVQKGQMHTIGERLSSRSAIDLNDPGRIQNGKKRKWRR